MIKLDSLTKQFTTGEETITAVNNMSLHVKHGDFLSIVGPSGSGKSTLMNILGLLDTADSGTYLLDGADVTTLDEDQQSTLRNQKIGFVFQSFYLLPKLTALRNVMVPLLYGGWNEKDAEARARQLLEQLHMSERADHLPKQLSGGQQQRVAIARALTMSPDIILADEPTGALDQHTGREIMKLMKQLNEDGQTIVLITHDQDIARQARHMIQIEDGRIVSETFDPSAQEVTPA